MPYYPLVPRTREIRIPLGEYAAGGKFRIDEKDLADLLRRVDRKQLSKAILRAADVAVGMWVTTAGKLMDREEPPFMKSRRKGILRDYRRWSVRLRARWDGSTARSKTSAMGGAAAALETGGTYEQWVKSYDRMMTYSSRGETTRVQRQRVTEHRRTRTETRARHYLGRAMVMVGPVWEKPLERAIEAVFTGGKVPPATKLRAGLLGGL